MKYYYMVMDGRAEYDINRALVLETIGYAPKNKALKEFIKRWAGISSCLVRYEIHKNEFVNPSILKVQA